MTQEQLKELIEYRDGKLYWRVKRQPDIKPGDEAGYYTTMKSGDRWKLIIFGKEYLRSRIVFFYFNGYFPEMVDHKDQDKLNDKIENLRAATRSQNMCNRKSFKNSKSQFFGVTLIKNKYWCARITSNGVAMYLGRYKNEIDAAIAYNKAAIIYHGEFANLNIICEI